MVFAEARPASVRVGSRVPRVDDRHVESLEVSGIACSDRGAARLCDAGDERIAQVRDAARPLAVGGELSGRHRGHRVESEHAIREVLRQHAVERAFEPTPASALRQQRQTESAPRTP